MNCLGVDWGKSKLGLAIGDDQLKIATPFKILKIKTYASVVSDLNKIVKEEAIGRLVLGRPRNLAGDQFTSTDFEKFVKELNGIALPVSFVDERLSTKLAVKKNLERPKHQTKDDDDLAAAEILQTYFDQM